MERGCQSLSLGAENLIYFPFSSTLYCQKRENVEGKGLNLRPSRNIIYKVKDWPLEVKLKIKLSLGRKGVSDG